MTDNIQITVVEQPIHVTANTVDIPIEVAVAVAEGIGDAPVDSTVYGRKNGGWIAISVVETDPIFLGSPAAGIGLLDIASWNNKQSALPVVDTQTIIKGSVDATKLLRFEVDGFTVGTTRTLTPPNQDIILAGQNFLNIFTVNQQITAHAAIGVNSSISNPGQLLSPGNVFRPILDIEETIASTVGIDAVDGGLIQLLISSENNAGSIFHGLHVQLETSPTFSNSAGHVDGIVGEVAHYGSGPVDSLYGSQFYASNYGNGNADYGYGILTGTYNSGGGAMIEGYGGYFYTSGSNIGTTYGLYVNASGGTVNYAIYTALGKIRLGGEVLLANYTSNGFLKTSGGGGTLSIDTNAYLTDAPSDGSTYGRKNGAWNAVAGGGTWGSITGTLSAQTDLQSALDAKQNSLGFTPPPNTRLISTTSPLSGGGDLSSDRTLSISQANTSMDGYLSSTDWNTFNNKQAPLSFPLASTLGGTGVNNAGTITNASNTTITGGGTIALGGFTLTVPATGIAALLATANVFTAAQKINVNSTTALFVEQDGVKDNVFIVDTTNGWVGVGGTPIDSLQVLGTATSGTTRLYDYGAVDSVPLNIGGNLRFIRDEVPLIGTNHNQADGVVNNSGSYKLQAKSNAASGWIDICKFSYAGLGILSRLEAPLGVGVGDASNSGQLFFRDTSAEWEFRLWSNNSRTLVLDGDHTNSAPTWPRTFLNVDNITGKTTHFGLGTTTNAVIETLKLQSQITTASTGGANGFGVGQSFYAETATDATYQQQGLISTSWIDATNASRKAKMSLSAYDTAARLGIEIEADGSVAKLGFFGVATVVRPTALTTQLTTITFTAPTPDYAIQDLINVAGYGFATKDEGNTVLSVIANLQTRVSELETKLQGLGLLT